MKYSTIIMLVGLGFAIPQCAWASQGVPELRGSLDTDYTNTKVAGATVATYGGGGDLLVSFPDWGIGLQGGGVYDTLNGKGWSANLWGANSHAFWRDADGMLGASFGYSSLSIASLNADARMYGAFGEYYATDYLTFRAKGGAVNGSIEKVSGHADGGYAGVGAGYYFLPDFRVNLKGDYVSINSIHFATMGASTEYLVSREIPLSISVGYLYTAMTGGSHTNTFMVGLKYRFGPDGSLVEQDRTGPVVWNGLLDLETLEL